MSSKQLQATASLILYYILTEHLYSKTLSNGITEKLIKNGYQIRLQILSDINRHFKKSWLNVLNV